MSRSKAARRAARATALARHNAESGVVVLTELTPEQLEEDRREEGLTWPARWGMCGSQIGWDS
jgi:hypothetical protein